MRWSFTAPQEVVFHSKTLGRLYIVCVVLVLLYSFLYAAAIGLQWARFSEPLFLPNFYLDSRNPPDVLAPPMPAPYCDNASYVFGQNLQPYQLDVTGGWTFPPSSPCRWWSPTTDFIISSDGFSFVLADVIQSVNGTRTARILQGVENATFHAVFSRAIVGNDGRTISVSNSGFTTLDLYHQNGSFLLALPFPSIMMSVRELLQLTGIDLDAKNPVPGFTPEQRSFYRISGVQILMYLQCKNNQPFLFLSKLDCSISFNAIPGTFGVLGQRYTDPQTPQQLSITQVGIRVVLVTGGAIGTADPASAVILVVNAIVLITFASKVVDIVGQWLLPRRDVYRKYRYVHAALKAPESGEEPGVDLDSDDDDPGAAQKRDVPLLSTDERRRLALYRDYVPPPSTV